MSKIYLASYYKKRKVTSLKTFWYRAFDTLTKVVTLGRYSHCEIAIEKEGKFDCYSSSKRDGGVRMKHMDLPADTWDLQDITEYRDAKKIIRFYNDTAGKGYDVIGLLSPIVGNWHSKDKYFCSEWCAQALGIKQPNKLSPIALYRIIARLIH